MKLNGIIVALCSVGILNAHAENVAIAKSSLVGDGIVEFVPQGFDQTKTPSLILKEEPTANKSVWRWRGYRSSIEKRPIHKTLEHRYGSLRRRWRQTAVSITSVGIGREKGR